VPSTRRSAKPPEPSPEFFVDRSLGRLAFPNGLRKLGFEVVTLWEAYGPEVEQQLDDDIWIVEQTAAGRVLLTRDELRQRRHREAIQVSQARVFRVGRGAQNVNMQIGWVTTNIHRIVQRSRRAGPFIDVVREKTVEKDWEP
jgi:hypothetical protein